jgi:hypothetical protein
MLEPLKIKKWTSHKHLETHEFWAFIKLSQFAKFSSMHLLLGREYTFQGL